MNCAFGHTKPFITTENMSSQSQSYSVTADKTECSRLEVSPVLGLALIGTNTLHNVNILQALPFQ